MSKAATVSQFEKFDQIVAWLFGQTDVPIKVTSAIIDRLSRNFRLDTRVGQLDAEQSRTPVLQFISKCDRLAQQLHQVVLRVVRIEGEDTPYNLPEKATGKSSSQKEKLELVLQHIVNTLDYIFNYMEDDLALLYLFCDMVVPAETKKSPPEAAAKRVFFVVERSKRIKLNLERLQMFVLIKHNGPDPTLVEDLLGLCQLSERGFITADEFEFRQGEAIENIVRAFVTQGRYLQQKEGHSLVIKRAKPMAIPDALPNHLRAAIDKLHLLLDGDFIDTNEYNSRAAQIVAKWQEERLREQEERARAMRAAASEKKSSPVAESEDQRWNADLQKNLQKNPEKKSSESKQVEESSNVEVIEEAPKVPEFIDESASEDRWEKPLPRGQKVRLKKPLPSISSTEETPIVPESRSGVSLPSSPSLSHKTSPIPSNSALNSNSSEDAALAKLTQALENQKAAKLAREQSATTTTNSPSPSLGRKRLSMSSSGGLEKSMATSLKAEKKRNSLFQRMASPTNSSSGDLSSPNAASISAPGGLSGSPGIFDNLSTLQLTAKKRNDSDAYRIHAVEKKMGMKEVIQMKACVDKTYVCDGHSLTVKLSVSNQSKKSVNCVKFILQTQDERVVHTVEDATRDVQPVNGDPIFPLIKRAWQGDLVYMLPVNIAAGFYKLRVQLFYNTRYNIETPIGVHVLTPQDMWQQNPLQVFGVPLDEVLKREGSQIPAAVSGPLQALIRESALTVEGIFRMSGDLTKILAIRDDMDSAKRPQWNEHLDTQGSQGVHIVAGVMKLFLRLLPHPLFTADLYDELLAAHGQAKDLSSMEAKVAIYRPLVARIPLSARHLFATLSDFVNRFVIVHMAVNKMTFANLSVIFGPVFVFRANLSPMEELSNASRVNGVVKEFFEAGRALFPEVIELSGLSKSSDSLSSSSGAISFSSSNSMKSIPSKNPPPPAGLLAVTSGGVPGSPPPTTASFRMGNRRNLMGTNRKTSETDLRKPLSPSAPEASGPAAVSAPEKEASGVSRPRKPLPPMPRSAMAATPLSPAPRHTVELTDDEEDDADN